MTKKISFIIKALNEEDNIAKCIESCLCEAEGYESEVILVDSISTDKTIEIAKKYPIKVIQFSNKEDASCGSAPQLGYQYSSGDYIFLIDGDMELQKGFIALAFVELGIDPMIAGVAGIITDAQVLTNADIRRVQEYAKIKKSIRVESLGGGGLYRRVAIDSVDYFTNKSLKACEESELGVRLASKGYKLIRLPTPSIMHTGHTENKVQRLKRLWSTGRIEAYSVFLKSAIGKPWFFQAFKKCWFLFVAPASLFLTVSAMLFSGSGIFSLSVFLAFWATTFLYLSLKRKSVELAKDSIISWWLFSLAIPNGFNKKVSNPLVKIPYREL
jgi:glycosyltransferase involved in cell wall biosynthesis